MYTQGRVSLSARNRRTAALRGVRSALRFSPTHDACFARSGLFPDTPRS
jgi:hypothetical protein